ncbi:galactose-1-phosphate uridylyltransferase [Alicyclobacillus kakegawensis]|uniref:galactose-1-phosphate uridylyltransferase n=1 Tax=Alicyclobacillus kakegawensis TaxID=392012 RepID=UPI00082B541D|nr:galactose-1-phosphate uridylyltransferase [Alicyclobacillus kakegawensis]
MAELRYNPLLGDWTMVASNRQKRPDMPKDYCPFCPGSGKVPEHYEVLVYDNDFPALSPNPPHPDDVATPLYQVADAYGKCEVVLYSPEHTTTLPQLSIPHIRKLVDLWIDRFSVLGEDPRHQYVLIFENRGPEVGVTMPHPHGQIYAYPYVPQKLRVELESCRNHHAATGHCLICDINQEELRFEQRVVAENDSFVAFIPFFTDYPYGVFISSRAHKSAITDLDDAERDDLAAILKSVTAGMDALFDREFPYMMVMHQRPVHDRAAAAYYHFHIEFYPPLRDRDKIKYLASSETGAWAPCNPTAVEETAPRLRAAIERARRGSRA